MQKVKVWLVSMVELAPVGQYHNYYIYTKMFFSF